MAGRKKGGNTAALVRELAEPIAARFGCQLWDVRFVKEGAEWFLRVFIDKPGGVSIDDCVDVTLNEFDYLLLDGEGDFNDRLTPNSKVVHTGAKAEGMLKNARPYDRFQFMRMGYYSAVKGYGEGRYEFNMITGLKDSYGK